MSRDIIVRGATREEALRIGVLGTRVFLDTYATEGIRSSIANEALQAFAPPAIARLMAEPGVALLVAECNLHLVGFAQVKLNT